jgi:phage terminase large subunit-like protein
MAAEDPTRVSLHTGSTLENSTLSAEYVQVLLDLYGGTALERQEIFGELVLIVEDALWRDEDFKRLTPPPSDELITVIGVDPGTTTGGDATGIVAVASTRHREMAGRLGYVLEDATDETNIGVSPERWAARVVSVAQRYAMPNGTPAPVIAESNQGGEMIRAVVKAALGGDRVPVILVRSISNKAARAEPVLHAYRRHRVYHAEGADLERLEDEMTTWEPKSGWSPNAMDAAVHGLRALLVDDRALRALGSVNVAEPTNMHAFPRAAWRNEQSRD